MPNAAAPATRPTSGSGTSAWKARAWTSTETPTAAAITTPSFILIDDSGSSGLILVGNAGSGAAGSDNAGQTQQAIAIKGWNGSGASAIKSVVGRGSSLPQRRARWDPPRPRSLRRAPSGGCRPPACA